MFFDEKTQREARVGKSSEENLLSRKAKLRFWNLLRTNRTSWLPVHTAGCRVTHAAAPPRLTAAAARCLHARRRLPSYLS